MKTSESITALAPALVRAQSAGLAVVAHNDNQQTRSKYANITDVLIAVLPILSAHGLAVLQFTGLARACGELRFVTITTRIQHVTGEFIEQDGEFPLAPPPKSGAGKDILNWSQTYGLALTYARRYALLSALGIASGDDRDAQDLQSAMRQQDGPAQYDEPEATWWSFVGFWQDHDAPGYDPVKTLGDLTRDERKAVQRSHYKTNPGVCASLWDDAEDALNTANLSYADVLKQWPDDPVVRNLPAAPADMKPAEVAKFMGWITNNISPVTK